MLVISAGVMNIILAGFLFMTLFLMGFKAPSSVVGYISPGSPAYQAGLRVGDKIINFNGSRQHDFTKITLNTALASPDEPLKVDVLRYDTGKVEQIEMQPIAPDKNSKTFLMLGIGPASSLVGAKPYEFGKDAIDPTLEGNQRAIKPGDVITAVNGVNVEPVAPGDTLTGAKVWARFDQTVQEARGNPIHLTVKRKDGKVESVDVRGEFVEPFGKTPFNIAGFLPRPLVTMVLSKSVPAAGKLLPGDIITAVGTRPKDAANDSKYVVESDMSKADFAERMNTAGHAKSKVQVTVVRDGKLVEVEILPDYSIGDDENGNTRKGLGVGQGSESQIPMIAGTLPDTAAGPFGSELRHHTITAVDGKPVSTWYDVRDLLATAQVHELTLQPPNAASPITRKITIAPKDVDSLKAIHATVLLRLGELDEIRKTGNPGIALGWGALETRDLILQFYVTLQRMFGGTVSPNNLMGPVGIVHAGAKFAFKGGDWLLWFLAMISANLAVVNFLPLPVVDGGHFVFLLIEKIRGRAVPAKIQEYALKFGVILILGLVLFVTKNDIVRVVTNH